MVTLLTEHHRRRLAPGEALARLPVPSTIVSNGEFTPPAQSESLRRYERLLLERSQSACEPAGRASWLASPVGMANAFAALNAVFDTHFDVGDGEADDADAAEAARSALQDQFVFDDQVHFLRDDADPALFEPLTGLIELSAELLGLPHAGRFDIEQIKFAISSGDLTSTAHKLRSFGRRRGVPMLTTIRWRRRRG